MIVRKTAISAALVFITLLVIWRVADQLPGASLQRLSTSSPLASTPAQETEDAHANEKPLLETTPASITTTPVKEAGAGLGTDTGSGPKAPLQSSQLVQTYFAQAFSLREPAAYDFPVLKEACDSNTWPEDDVYLECNNMHAGLTSIISQVKVCFKMAIEAGTGLVLPSMPIRDPTNLLEYNLGHPEKYLTYDQWFDAQHVIDSFARACPKMKIVRPSQLDTEVAVKNRWSIDMPQGYNIMRGYFWVGRPFKTHFNEQMAVLEQLSALNPNRNDTAKGITVVTMGAQFLLFRITDDPTHKDLRLWNDISSLIRFNEGPRKIVDGLLNQINGRSFYGVHFRVENDTIWSSLDDQLKRDLDGLDHAWSKYGSPDPSAQKPLVYLACGDSDQVEKFVSAGKERGWEVTHKWALAEASGRKEILDVINELPFDFQGAVDMGIMLKSEFFFGITGSAFSSSVANLRDPTGRYRGSSLLIANDDGARNHLVNDGDASDYACCL
ncbi:hypothetical protein F5884DRAFT_794855 [Xylogone sp. PMI_703]|nr:hypothetical protein F5884DRAFT_794855 [Xylogone sp. PMI_703]